MLLPLPGTQSAGFTQSSSSNEARLLSWIVVQKEVEEEEGRATSVVERIELWAIM